MAGAPTRADPALEKSVLAVMTMKVTLFKDCPVGGGNTFLQTIYLTAWFHIPEGCNLQLAFTREQSRICPLILCVVQIYYELV
jgi:hypothetical protein